MLGVPADEVHVCGDPAMVDIVEEICRNTGDTVEIHRYARKTSLQISAEPVKGWKELKRGDAVISFSRRGKPI